MRAIAVAALLFGMAFGCAEREVESASPRDHFVNGWDFVNQHTSGYYEREFLAAIQGNPNEADYWVALGEFYHTTIGGVPWASFGRSDRINPGVLALLREQQGPSDPLLREAWTAARPDDVASRCFIMALTMDRTCYAAWQGLSMTIYGRLDEAIDSRRSQEGSVRHALRLRVLEAWAKSDARNALPVYWLAVRRIADETGLTAGVLARALRRGNLRPDLIDRRTQPPADCSPLYKRGRPEDHELLGGLKDKRMPPEVVAWLWNLSLTLERPENFICSSLLDDYITHAEHAAAGQMRDLAVEMLQMGKKFMFLEPPRLYSALSGSAVWSCATKVLRTLPAGEGEFSEDERLLNRIHGLFQSWTPDEQPTAGSDPSAFLRWEAESRELLATIRDIVRRGNEP